MAVQSYIGLLISDNNFETFHYSGGAAVVMVLGQRSIFWSGTCEKFENHCSRVLHIILLLHSGVYYKLIGLCCFKKIDCLDSLYNLFFTDFMKSDKTYLTKFRPMLKVFWTMCCVNLKLEFCADYRGINNYFYFILYSWQNNNFFFTTHNNLHCQIYLLRCSTLSKRSLECLYHRKSFLKVWPNPLLMIWFKEKMVRAQRNS